MAELAPFSGVESFRADPGRIFRALTDPEALAAAVPEKLSYEVAGPRTLKCVVKPGFAFMRATLKMTLEIAEATPDSLVQFRIASSGIGASMRVACTMRIAPEGAGSRVDWEAHVTELSGLIAAVSPALIRGAAEKVIRDGWSALRRQVEA